MKVTTYLILTSVDGNFNHFELGFFEGILATLGITDYASNSFTSTFKSYTFVTTKENDALINRICTDKEIHFKKGNVEIHL